MGSRVMYHHLNIEHVGINKFEKILSNNGLSIKVKRRRIITTEGIHEKDDKNQINGRTLSNINQVISGDITYLIMPDKTYYIFTLKDMYSKRIIGLHGSDNMLSMNAIITLRQGIKLRGSGLEGCIHHTDAGSQYKSTVYKKLLKDNKMIRSIAQDCLQNGMAEQLNGVIKNDYTISEVKNVKDLNKQLMEIKRLINENRPVESLSYMTPVEYEEWLTKVNEKPKIILHDFTEEKRGL
jgi:putative transposase